MNPRAHQANEIADKRSLRLSTIEAVAVELAEKYGAGASDHRDDHQAALWYWVACECRSAREALGELAGLVRRDAGGDL